MPLDTRQWLLLGAVGVGGAGIAFYVYEKNKKAQAAAAAETAANAQGQNAGYGYGYGYGYQNTIPDYYDSGTYGYGGVGGGSAGVGGSSVPAGAAPGYYTYGYGGSYYGYGIPGGVTGAGSPTTPAGGSTTPTSPPATSSPTPKAGGISNLRQTGKTKTSVSLAWNPSPNAYGYHYALTALSNGASAAENNDYAGTSVTIGGLKTNTGYNFGIQGLPGGPGNNIHVSTT